MGSYPSDCFQRLGTGFRLQRPHSVQAIRLRGLDPLRGDAKLSSPEVGPHLLQQHFVAELPAVARRADERGVVIETLQVFLRRRRQSGRPRLADQLGDAAGESPRHQLPKCRNRHEFGDFLHRSGVRFETDERRVIGERDVVVPRRRAFLHARFLRRFPYCDFGRFRRSLSADDWCRHGRGLGPRVGSLPLVVHEVVTWGLFGRFLALKPRLICPPLDFTLDVRRRHPELRLLQLLGKQLLARFRLKRLAVGEAGLDAARRCGQPTQQVADAH